jgi:hypothetical protein
MKEVLQQWVDQQTRLPGVLACGLRFPDKTSFTRCWSAEFAVPNLDRAWRCASDAYQVLKINFPHNDYVRWVYQNAFLYTARREDGVCLGIFTTRDPRACDPVEMERLLAEFRTLDGQTH